MIQIKGPDSARRSYRSSFDRMPLGAKRITGSRLAFARVVPPAPLVADRQFQEVHMPYTLRNPISENPHLRDEAAVVSHHASTRSAYRALLRLRRTIPALHRGLHRSGFAP